METSERRAPVQADRGIPKECPGHCAGTISWYEHEQVWSAYHEKYRNLQTAERIAERGGFGYAEIVYLTGKEPITWRRWDYE